MRRWLTGSLLAGALISTTAWAAPLEVRHGRSIRVTIAGKSEEAIALRPSPTGPTGPAGWRLELAPRTASGTLVVHDVTLGATGPRSFELALTPTGVLLDVARFRPDHAYRVELRRGTTIVGSVLVYLTPAGRQRGPVVFDDREANGNAADDGELVTSDTGTL